MRKVSIVLAILVVVGGVVVFKKLGQRPPEETKAELKGQRPVQTDSIAVFAVPLRQSFTGTVAATRRMTIVSEVPGLLTTNQGTVREGAQFAKGETLFSIDSREPSLALIAQRSAYISLLTQQLADLAIDFPSAVGKWEAYLSRADERKPLPDLPETTDIKERRFLTARGAFDKFYTIRSAEARLDKFAVQAPFHGTLAKGGFSTGTQVMVGQQLGELIDPDSYELETSVPYKVVQQLHTGARAKLFSGTDTIYGTVSRISDRVDQRTQSVAIFISVPGLGLRDGMYLSGHVQFGEAAMASLVRQAQVLSDGTVLSIAADSTIVAIPVKVLHVDGDEVVISGLPKTQLLVRNPTPDLNPGTKVTPVH